MPRRKKKSRRPDRGVFALLLLGLGVVAALIVYVKTTPADRVPEALRRERPAAVKPAPAPTSVWVYTVRSEGVGNDFSRSRTTVPKGQDARVFACNEFLEAAKIAPQGSRLLSVDVVEGEAQLHFNEAFDTTYGASDESALIQGLQRTFGQFQEISALRLYIGDAQMQSTGNIDLTEPVPVIR